VTINLNTSTPPDPIYRWLGATIKNLSGQEYSAVGIPVDRTGIYLINVPAGSLAAQAGFQANDLILRIGGAGDPSVDQIDPATAKLPVKIELWRQQKSVRVEMNLPHEQPAQAH
jgi:S1-C subfamily serine protease